MGSPALKCHFLSLKGTFFQKTMSPASSSPSLLKEKDKKSSLIWHLFLTTNDRGAMDLITRNEKSVRGLGYHDSIGKVASRGLDCHVFIGKVSSRDLDYHESIGKVTGRGLGHYKTSLNTNN